MATVLLVRHAEIDLPPVSANPDLNEAGRARAKDLLRVVTRSGIAHAFSSSLARTQQTLEPLSDALAVPVSLAPEPVVLAAKVRTGSLDGVILVAGHSNTIPQYVAALGVGQPCPAIDESDFANLFVVTVPQSGEAAFVHLVYGRS